MHHAYPPRKRSNPPPFAPRSARLPIFRRSRVRFFAAIGLAVIGLLYLFSGRSTRIPKEHIPSGDPPVVIVTVFDESGRSPEYITLQKENRVQYAEKNGYGIFFAKYGDYDTGGSPQSWTKVVAMRHAMTKFPDCRYLWYLEQDSFIMSPKFKIEEEVMGTKKLEELMIKDRPVVPPDSIIKTFSHLKGDDVDFVLTQDKEGMSAGSFILRNGEWAKFFLDTWFDPLYRSYNFQRAETHALEHIVQWHPTILSKLAFVPQRTINAYHKELHGDPYEEGDVAIRFVGCPKTGDKSCEKQAEPYAKQWKNAFKSS